MENFRQNISQLSIHFSFIRRIAISSFCAANALAGLGGALYFFEDDAIFTKPQASFVRLPMSARFESRTDSELPELLPDDIPILFQQFEESVRINHWLEPLPISEAVKKIDIVIPTPEMKYIADPTDLLDDISEFMIVEQPKKNKKSDRKKTAENVVTKSLPIGIQNRPPTYPTLAKKRGYEGEVKLELSVDQKGCVVAVSLVSGSKYEILNRSAIKAVKTWVFEPAKIDGIPVESKITVPVIFRLED